MLFIWELRKDLKWRGEDLNEIEVCGEDWTMLTLLALLLQCQL